MNRTYVYETQFGCLELYTKYVVKLFIFMQIHSIIFASLLLPKPACCQEVRNS